MNELAKALIGTSAFTAPKSILQAVSDSTALKKPKVGPGSSTRFEAPHSIYDEVWHLAIWQEISLDWIQGKPTPVPVHASEGFPSNSDEAWASVHERFLAGTQNAAAVANDTERLEVMVACPNVDAPDRTMTIHDQLVSLAAHNAYHLGRVVLLRQLLGNWPPPDGGYSW